VINLDNVDFYWNVLEFWLNLCLEQSVLNIAGIALVQARQRELQQMFSQSNCVTPVQFFKQHLQKNYKLAQEAQDEETKDAPDLTAEGMHDNEEDLEQPVEEEDPNA